MKIKNKVRLEFENSKKSIIFNNSSIDLLLIPLFKLFSAEKERTQFPHKIKIYLRNWIDNKAGVQQTVYLYGNEAEITEKIKKYLI